MQRFFQVPSHYDELTSDDFVRLEVVRGIAALVVVINHARGWLWAGGNAVSSSGATAEYGWLEWAFYVGNQLTRCGHEAVILFFVLSGFSIAHSLRPRVRHRARALAFYRRRIVRLYPPYFLGLIWAAVAAVLSIELLKVTAPSFFVYTEALTFHDQWDASSLLGNLFYAVDMPFTAQYWSLTHEVFFYLLAPIFFLAPGHYITTSLLLLGMGIVLGLGPKDGVLIAFVFRYNAFFAIGVLLYAKRDVWRGLVDRVPVVYLFVLLGTAFLSMVFFSYRLGAGPASEGLAVLMAAISIPLVLRIRPRNRFLLWLGEQSYTLYVSHLATIALVASLLVGLGLITTPIVTPYLWPIAVPIAVLASKGFFYLGERPTRMWLDRARARAAKSRDLAG